jgi:hypothetical protein
LLIGNLSGVVSQGDNLWLGGDEGTMIERLTKTGPDRFAQHRRFDLASLITLPGGKSGEIDVEGLDMDDGFLWLVGSHSLRRKKPDEALDDQTNLARMAEITEERNRLTLARVPLGPDATLTRSQNGHSSAVLKNNGESNVLLDALREDEHIGVFLRTHPGKPSIPSKDNGLDIEGLAVADNRVFLGFRGPVLRGWAIVLELLISHHDGALHLEPFNKGRTYRKHFLQLGGLGIRDLTLREQELYILAGPTMALDGPVFVYRWKQALQQTGDSITWGQLLRQELALAFGNGVDHAEGMTFLQNDPGKLLVCYDSPRPERIQGSHQEEVRVDVFAL